MDLRLLKKHPFAVSAFFERSTVLTFAIAKDKLTPLIPSCLELDVFQDRWAFVAVALVQTKDLRPSGLPRFLGSDFFLIGYRIFVRYKTSRGKRLRGLYIIKSETNKRKMQILGNIFTRYDYTTTDIAVSEDQGERRFHSKQSGFEFAVSMSNYGEISLPPLSPFAAWGEARRYAGPLPFTFTYDEADDSMLIIEGVRSNWKPNPINVIKHKFAFLDQPQFAGLILASAFELTAVPYKWKKGKTDPCT